MAQDVRRIREQLSKEHRASIEQLDAFDLLARQAYSEPWWRAVISAVQERRMTFLNELVTTQQDQRAEDQLRGRIQELTFLLTIDANAKRLAEDKEN